MFMLKLIHVLQTRLMKERITQVLDKLSTLNILFSTPYSVISSLVIQISDLDSHFRFYRSRDFLQGRL